MDGAEGDGAGRAAEVRLGFERAGVGVPLGRVGVAGGVGRGAGVGAVATDGTSVTTYGEAGGTTVTSHASSVNVSSPALRLCGT